MSENPTTSPTVSWYITFGLGSGQAGRYTEVVVSASLSRAEQEEKVRHIAYATYGSWWAFEYPPESFERAIGRYDLILRERLEVTA